MAYASWTGGSGAGLPYDDQAMQELLQKLGTPDGGVPGTGPGMGDPAPQTAQGSIGANGVRSSPSLASGLASAAQRFPAVPGHGVPQAGVPRAGSGVPRVGEPGSLSPAALAAQQSIGGRNATPGPAAAALARRLQSMPATDPNLQPSKGQPPISPDEDPDQQMIFTGKF